MTDSELRDLEREVVAAWEDTLPDRQTLAAWYRRIVDELLEILRQEGDSLRSVTGARLDMLVAPLQSAHHAIAAMSLRRLFEIAIAKGLRSDNPVNIKPKRKAVAVPVVLTQAEVLLYLDHLRERARSVTEDARTKLTSARTYAAFELIYSAGLKIHEVRRLRRDDVFSRPPSINYPGVEGGRLVPITRRALDAVRWWEFLAIGYGDVRGEWLFHSATFPLEPITEQSFAAGIKVAIGTAPLEVRHLVTPEAVRYSLAVHLKEAGMELTELAYLFGYTQRHFFQRAFPTVFD